MEGLGGYIAGICARIKIARGVEGVCRCKEGHKRDVETGGEMVCVSF